MAGLLLGGVLYAVSMKEVLAYKHLELIDSYNGLQQMGRAVVRRIWPGPPAGARTNRCLPPCWATMSGTTAACGWQRPSACCWRLACLVLALRCKAAAAPLVQAAILLVLLPLGLNVVYPAVGAGTPRC